MKVAARLGPGWPCSATHTDRPSRIGRLAPAKPEHPIVRDQVAVERAIAALLGTVKADAIRRGVTPEDDVASEAFRREHGTLAAYIADPVGETCAAAAILLLEHLKRIAPAAEIPAAAARIDALVGKASRYGAAALIRH